MSITVPEKACKSLTIDNILKVFNKFTNSKRKSIITIDFWSNVNNEIVYIIVELSQVIKIFTLLYR